MAALFVVLKGVGLSSEMGLVLCAAWKEWRVSTEDPEHNHHHVGCPLALGTAAGCGFD
jgi:hypothetical protein